MKATPMTDSFIDQFCDLLSPWISEFEFYNQIKNFHKFIINSNSQLNDIKQEIHKSIPNYNDIPDAIKFYRIKFQKCWDILNDRIKWFKSGHFDNFLEMNRINGALTQAQVKGCKIIYRKSLSIACDFFDDLSVYFEELKMFINQNTSNPVIHIDNRIPLKESITDELVFRYWMRLEDKFINGKNDVELFCKQIFCLNESISDKIKIFSFNHSAKISKCDIYHLCYKFYLYYLPKEIKWQYSETLKNTLQMLTDTDTKIIYNNLREYKNKNDCWKTNPKDLKS